MKLVVPSSGSMIQTYSESPEAPDSSARIACCGYASLSTPMMASSAALSTSVTKSLSRLALTLMSSTSREARLMMPLARRAALMAMLSVGFMGVR